MPRARHHPRRPQTIERAGGAIDDQPPQIHVLDFGLAWLRQDALDARLDGNKPMEFAPHAGAGTPGYMAPEQIQHENAPRVRCDGFVFARLHFVPFVRRARAFSGESKELCRVHAFEQPPALKA